ncbi:diaminopimelate decarboxylase family protein [Clostridium cellulovorans]|uniref:Orn/DAP/Arg decarboxylase 2 n=1 Tax=Clostridium cellulovorans (strain ATCC 35296 / DSM 3052 / OCM 3 / 743B) TaxID=573061 RepID=D9STT0_CLOC7|nr:decarboxylase [Clostridium cellulovorans]ADL52814.1 Orn/DAP/Arg decarboxylase 2 [Clostridium cellulovorans 743B]
MKKGKIVLNFKSHKYDKYIDFTNKNILGYSIDELEQKYGMPLHILFGKKIEENIMEFRNALNNNYTNSKICFAVKSSCSIGVLRIINKLGCGVDVSSYNEFKFAEIAEIPYDRMVFNGNCKTDEIIELAITKDILINVDSVYEFERILEISKNINKKAKVLIRLSGLKVDKATDECIYTSGEWTKFGINYLEAKELLTNNSVYHQYIDVYGFQVHIGSQIGYYEAYINAIEKIVKLSEELAHIGNFMRIINIGGGFPINYVDKVEWEQFQKSMAYKGEENSNCFIWKNEKADYKVNELFYTDYEKSKMLEKVLNTYINYKDSSKKIKDVLKEIGEPELIIEPGRSIVGDAGITIAKVNGIKKVNGNNLLVVEMGNVNYAGSVIHNLFNCWDLFKDYSNVDSNEEFSAFICGNLCYNGDMISNYKIKFDREPKRGEYVITYDVGGTESHFFASNANMNPIPSRLLINDKNDIEILKSRQTLEDLMK